MAAKRQPIPHGPLSHADAERLLRGPLQPDDDRARALWGRHRELLMAPYDHGRRPAAWWCFEHPDLHCAVDRQASTLFAAGLLGDDERAALVAEWRKQFERILDPRFSMMSGGRVITGTDARVAHVRWADVPRSLLEEWAAAYMKKPRPEMGI